MSPHTDDGALDCDKHLASSRETLQKFDCARAPVSPEEYLARYRPAPVGDYRVPPGPLRDAERALAQHDPTLARACNRHLALQRLDNFRAERTGLQLPASCVALYPPLLRRLLDRWLEAEDTYFSLDCDPFAKDLAIVDGKLIPLGAEFALVEAGIPRSLLWSGGAEQALRFGAYLLRRGGRLRGYLELHAHPEHLEDFSPEGWRQTMDRLRELLRANTQVRGVFSTSWFLDPALAKISPRLAYLRSMSLDSGARLYFSSLDTEGRSGALAKSATRRRLFDQGEYVPALYTRIWDRSALA